MAAINDLIRRVSDPGLRALLEQEAKRLTNKKSFGLVYEKHLPDNILLPEVAIRRGTKVVLRGKDVNDIYEVQAISNDKASCRNIVSFEDKEFPISDLVAVAQQGDVVYPYLKPMDSVENAPDSDIWHTLIEADNYHALQALAYLYPGMVDCIYIDPPYNKPDSHDWKYNCDYVDGADAYRHSKWLSMMETRLKIAKKLLNPKDSVLIVTIDEMEYNHLGCLLEQMFPEASMQMISSVINPSGVSRNNEFFRTDEYIYILRFGSCTPAKIHLPKEWITAKTTGKDKLRWRRIRRQGSHDLRSDAANQFYPIYISKDGSHYVGAGRSLDISENKEDFAEAPADVMVIWPLKPDGTEGCWQISQQTLKDLYDKGYIKVTHTKKWGYTPQYLAQGERKKVENGQFPIVDYDEYGTIVTEDSIGEAAFVPGTQWRISLHNAREQGSKLLRKVFGEKRFDFPKSLYAEVDVLRFFLANKPGALTLDFFAGSGTTLHAVNLLNAEDGGRRRCIMVTNNEIGETKEKELAPKGIRPGDEEWERWGIARYVNWPRTKCSILGEDVNGKPIKGEYITYKRENKNVNRIFTQINFFSEGAALNQKQALVSLINKQEDVQLPALKEDVPFLVSEDDNATILFDPTEIDAWLDSVEGNDQIEYFYVVTSNNKAFKQAKREVQAIMGPIEETVPVNIPMSDGFKANAAYFKLGFLDKRSVSRGRQLQELLPMLWMKAGAKGKCPGSVNNDFQFFLENRMAILVSENCFPLFKDEMQKHQDIDIVFLVTDSQSAYLAMTADLGSVKTYQLYKDYLENFRINYSSR